MLRRIVATVPALCFIKLGVIDIFFCIQTSQLCFNMKMMGDSTCIDSLYSYSKVVL